MRTLLLAALLLLACSDTPAVPHDATLDSNASDASAEVTTADVAQEPPNAPVADAGLDADR